MQSISHSQISGIVLFSARVAGRNAVSQLSDFTFVLISDIFFDEASGKTLGELFAIHKGFTRCYAHQWMRVEKLVSMLSFSARDLKPQIKFFKKTFRNSVRRVICGCNRKDSPVATREYSPVTTRLHVGKFFGKLEFLVAPLAKVPIGK